MTPPDREVEGPGEANDAQADAERGGKTARADAAPELVSTAKMIRRILPGDESYGDALSTSGGDLRERLGRGLSGIKPEQPSAVREIGLGFLQAWQALSEAQKRRRGAADTAILFTDLVGFSSWALEAGDEVAIELLRSVGEVEETSISGHGGVTVKRLGDGSMAVFGDPASAVTSAFRMQGDLGEIEVSGYRPQLRAGVHLGRPRKVGDDYLGIDVNIAARVGDAAKGDQILVSEPIRDRLDPEEFKLGRKRKLRAPGAPDQLVVYSATPRSG